MKLMTPKPKKAMKNKEVKNKKELLSLLKKLPIKGKEHRNSVICSLIGHSRISTVCFGYRNCGRCGDQLGDSLMSIDMGASDAVVIGHNCDKCRENYKKCDWRDKLYVKNPFLIKSAGKKNKSKKQ